MARTVEKGRTQSCQAVEAYPGLGCNHLLFDEVACAVIHQRIRQSAARLRLVSTTSMRANSLGNKQALGL